MSATELELRAQLVAAQATINALRVGQVNLEEEQAKNAMYQRQDAKLWDTPLLKELTCAKIDIC